MSYQVRNEEMGFLEKIADELEKLEEENSYLEVDGSDVPRSTDRYPYTEDDVVEEHPFYFYYKEVELDIYPSTTKNAFQLKIVESTDENTKFKKVINLTKDEDSEQLKQMWKELLVEIETAKGITTPSRYFFNKWWKRQSFATTLHFKKNKENAVEKLYAALTTLFTPEEIERKLEERHKKDPRVGDISISSKIACSVGVEFHRFMINEAYVVLSQENVFVFLDHEEALKKYEEEAVIHLKEKIKEDIKEYKRY